MKMQKKKQENSDSKYQKNTEMTAKAQHFFLFQENHSESMFSNGSVDSQLETQRLNHWKKKES